MQAHCHTAATLRPHCSSSTCLGPSSDPPVPFPPKSSDCDPRPHPPAVDPFTSFAPFASSSAVPMGRSRPGEVGDVEAAGVEVRSRLESSFVDLARARARRLHSTPRRQAEHWGESGRTHGLTWLKRSNRFLKTPLSALDTSSRLRGRPSPTTSAHLRKLNSIARSPSRPAQ